MISNRSHYALRAMLELALHDGRGPVTIADIAAAQKIPTRFLEAIMRHLKQAGLADSVRGKEGGYFLARPATEVHVGTILALFEGPIFTAAEQRSPTRIHESEQDIFADIWREAEEAVNTTLARHTLAALLEKEYQRRFSSAPSYAI